MHDKRILTESELKDYLRDHVGIVTPPAPKPEQPLIRPTPNFSPYSAPLSAAIQPKRRGRPKGSKNRPKEVK